MTCLGFIWHYFNVKLHIFFSVCLLLELQSVSIHQFVQIPNTSVTSKVVYKLDNLVYLVKNMSLAEVNTEDVWNGDHESDQMRKSKSLVITQQFAETFHNTGEDDGTKAPEEYVPATRRRAMTEKGRDYKLKIMKERRQKLHKRTQRSWNTIEELELSERNMAPVQQELAQFNDVYKLFVNLHEELNPMLEDSERAADDEWFEDIDERVCTFKRKTHNWLRVAEDNQHSRCPSSRSKGSRSSGQSRSSGSSKSKGSKSS